MIGCILVAGVAVGLQTYPEYQDESQITWLLLLNCLVLLTFNLEVMVKLCAQVKHTTDAWARSIEMLNGIDS